MAGTQPSPPALLQSNKKEKYKHTHKKRCNPESSACQNDKKLLRLKRGQLGPEPWALSLLCRQLGRSPGLVLGWMQQGGDRCQRRKQLPAEHLYTGIHAHGSNSEPAPSPAHKQVLPQYCFNYRTCSSGVFLDCVCIFLFMGYRYPGGESQSTCVSSARY